MTRRLALALLATLALLLALAVLAPPIRSDVPAGRSMLAPSDFVPLSVVLPTPVGSATVAPRSAGPDAPGYNPALRSSPTTPERKPAPSPSLRAVPRLAATAAPLSGPKPAPGDQPLADRAAASMTGLASWFASPIGVSAAGPALRAALGGSWRGTRVRVTGPAGSAWTVLGDWMAANRLIDLDVNVFPAVCGPLSLGLCRAEVMW